MKGISDLKRIKLIVSYDGTNYSGWQLQNNAETIEGVLNGALSSLTGESIIVTGASRTDAGVHALGNVCVFDSDTRIPPEKIALAVNTRLPEDIRVIHSCEVSKDFHPRHADTLKTYEYRIWNDRIANPLQRLYTNFIYYDIDTDAMYRASRCLIGEHDFKSFCSAGSNATTTVRTVTGIDIERDGCLITIRVKGTGFLYNMVRIIAGSLMNVGMGLSPESSIQEMLEAKDRAAAGPTAPACGLTLMGIVYPNGEDRDITG